MSERQEVLKRARTERSFHDWQTVNRYTRSMDILWDQMMYILESDEYKKLECPNVTRKFKELLDVIDTEIRVWKHHSDVTRECLVEQCESRTKD